MSSLSPSRYRWCLLGLGASVLLFTLDLSIVNIALPTMTRELKTDFATIQWVVLSYLLVVAALLSAAARAGDLYDKKKLFLSGLAVFVVSSLGCALAPSVGWLIAARGVQGLGAVLVSALSMAIVTAVAPPEKRGQAIGTVGGLISLGIAIGPSLGGWIISVTSWHWIFLVNVPVGVLAYGLLHFLLPAMPPPTSWDETKFDWPGMLALSAWLVCLDLGLNLVQREGIASPKGAGLVVGSFLCLAFFIWWERRHTSPLIALEMFRRRTLWLGLLQGVAVFIVLAGSLFLMPFFLDGGMGYEPLTIGWLMAVAPVTAGLVSPLAGRWADRAGERVVVTTGLLLMALGCFLISRFHEEMTEWRYVLAYFPFGVGVGTFQAPNNSAIMGGAPKDRMGTVSGLLALSRTLGQSMGLPLMATLFVLLATNGGAASADIAALQPAALIEGIHGTFLLAGGLLLVTALFGSYLGRKGRGETSSDE